MEEERIHRERSPGMKLFFAGLVSAVLIVPLMLVYALVYDRQNQSETAQASINAGWGGAQVLSGPVLAVPFRIAQTQNVTVDGKPVSRVVDVEKTLYISPITNHVKTRVDPERRTKSIYRSVLFTATTQGKATFALPSDLSRFGVTPGKLLWNRAELRIGVSDARGLTTGGKIQANGVALDVQPGKGPAASGGQGFFAFLEWSGSGMLDVDYSFGLRGSRTLSLVPRGGSTEWEVTSSWPSPSFAGAFLPEKRQISDKGFTATYTVDKLALGQPPVDTEDYAAPQEQPILRDPVDGENGVTGPSRAVSVSMIETVDLYSKVDRSVKYGFLFIGFTFLVLLLFDIVGDARVAAVEYLLTGAGLVLFFVLLLAFAEVIGFTGAYLAASAAVIGLLTAYSAAILKSRRRAGFVGALLVGLYALLFVLLNLEAWSLMIGSVLLLIALAGVMYATRNVDWGSVGRSEALR